MQNKSKSKLILPLIAISLTLTGCIARNAPPAPVLHLGQGNVESMSGFAIVRPGDTISTIAKRYSVSNADIIAINGLSSANGIQTGKRLRLPPPREYLVGRGDTIYSISKMLGIKPSELAKVNNLRTPYYLYENQRLTMPKTSYIAPRFKSPAFNNTPDPIQLSRGPSIAIDPVETTSIDFDNPNIEPIDVVNNNQIMQEPIDQTSSNIADNINSSSKHGFIWPVRGPILSSFGSKNNGLHNDGINIAAPSGEPIIAAKDGTVVYVGDELSSFGNLILVKHNDGLMTAYGHLSEIDVNRGDTVKQGYQIGTVGKTGDVDNYQLHFEVRRGSVALNPEEYL